MNTTPAKVNGGAEMLMSLAEEIEAQNVWFNSKQDAFYSWFKDSGKETIKEILIKYSEKHRDGDAKFDGFDKYIVDAGDYSFLLVGSDGSVDKLSQTFDLSEENTNLGGNEFVVNLHVTVWKEPLEEVRFFPANNQYDFPLRDNNDETFINPLFLSAVDEVYGPYLEALDPQSLSVKDDFWTQFEVYFQAVSEQENNEDMSPDIILNDLLISNLVKVILPRYYTFPWADIEEEFADPKEPYLRFVQGTFPIFSEDALNMTKGEVVDLLLGKSGRELIRKTARNGEGRNRWKVSEPR
ncbi:MAG: hypothetical protein ABFS45_24720 [Pseudomonadota bacterium]